jgi:hypothetical protein
MSANLPTNFARLAIAAANGRIGEGVWQNLAEHAHIWQSAPVLDLMSTSKRQNWLPNNKLLGRSHISKPPLRETAILSPICMLLANCWHKLPFWVRFFDIVISCLIILPELQGFQKMHQTAWVHFAKFCHSGNCHSAWQLAEFRPK